MSRNLFANQNYLLQVRASYFDKGQLEFSTYDFPVCKWPRWQNTCWPSALPNSNKHSVKKHVNSKCIHSKFGQLTLTKAFLPIWTFPSPRPFDCERHLAKLKSIGFSALAKDTCLLTNQSCQNKPANSDKGFSGNADFAVPKTFLSGMAPLAKLSCPCKIHVSTCKATCWLTNLSTTSSCQ